MRKRRIAWGHEYNVPITARFKVKIDKDAVKDWMEAEEVACELIESVYKEYDVDYKDCDVPKDAVEEADGYSVIVRVDSEIYVVQTEPDEVWYDAHELIANMVFPANVEFMGTEQIELFMQISDEPVRMVI